MYGMTQCRYSNEVPCLPSLVTWKKDSSGSSISMRRTAESKGFRRDVSLFHLVTWVHLCLVGFVGLVVVGFFCCWFLLDWIAPRFFAWHLPRAK